MGYSLVWIGSSTKGQVMKEKTMKTCKDCIYHSKLKLRKNLFDEDAYYAECHFNPSTIVTFSEHWCGQLKENLQSVIEDDWKANLGEEVGTPINMEFFVDFMANYARKNRKT